MTFNPFSEFSSGAAASTAFSVLSLILAIVATVLAFVFFVPEKRREKLNAFGKFIHDTCNFKYLIVEKLLQALYIFATAFVILNGFFMLFQTTYGHWLGGYGLLTMIIGPIVIRLVYELLMMMVLLVKNVIAINNKLKNQNNEGSKDIFATPDISAVRESFKQYTAPAQPAAPAQSAAPEQPKPAQNTTEAPQFCTACGAKLDETGKCPNCNH